MQNLTVGSAFHSAPFILGVFFELFVLGMIGAHMSLYFRRGSKDPKVIRALLGFVVFCLFIKSILNVKRVYTHGVFAHIAGKRRPVLPWTDLVAVFLADVPLVAAQSYLCYRLWVASQRKKWPAAIGVGGIILSTLSFLMFFVRTVMQVRTRKWPSKLDIWAPLWAFSLCARLAYYLLRTRKRAVAQRLDYTILRLALLAITTCIPPALVSAAMAILEITATVGAGRSWNFCTVILGSVYTLCILYSCEYMSV
ncbi:BQ2448_6904 [Microbotryum intermedium]|uniref:BQ2448_6904 protein n=1 Tax=Microbotryum intermedium TaxID=269621 RepID=A0A238FJL4_9BASI|nr:BQ2448_6904 [Microbotryum intermedium]